MLEPEPKLPAMTISSSSGVPTGNVTVNSTVTLPTDSTAFTTIFTSTSCTASPSVNTAVSLTDTSSLLRVTTAWLPDTINIAALSDVHDTVMPSFSNVTGNSKLSVTSNSISILSAVCTKTSSSVGLTSSQLTSTIAETKKNSARNNFLAILFLPINVIFCT